MLQKLNEFKIKRFSNSREKDFIDALTIYSHNIAPEIKTSTNEIVYWIDNFNTRTSEELFVFGLYFNSVLVGYAQLVYFCEDKFVFIDYLCLSDPYKKNALFYPLYNLIENYLNDNRCDYNYIITEVSYRDDDTLIDNASVFLLNLLFMENYGIADAQYFQPLLGLENEDSYFENKLMLKSIEPIKRIKKETYLRLIHTIYFKHYLSWYEPFLADKMNEYKKHIDHAYTILLKNVKDDIHVFNTYSKIYGDKKIIATNIQSTASPVKEETISTSEIRKSFIFVLILLLINVCLWIVVPIFNINIPLFLTGFVISLVSLFVFFALFSKRAEGVLNKLPSIFNDLLNKK